MTRNLIDELGELICRSALEQAGDEGVVVDAQDGFVRSNTEDKRRSGFAANDRKNIDDERRKTTDNTYRAGPLAQFALLDASGDEKTGSDQGGDETKVGVNNDNT